METSQKMLLMGVGFIIGGLLILFNIKRGIFPKDGIKKQYVIATIAFILGVILTTIGIFTR